MSPKTNLVEPVKQLKLVEERVKWFEKEALLLEAQRIRMRTEYDLEMLVIGFWNG